jgi:hypothetical protein
MPWPLLHPFHASTSADHLLLWAAVGVGIGVAVLLGRRIIRDLLTPEDADESGRS